MDHAPAAVAPPTNTGIWPRHYVLSFDPGTRHLGAVLIAYGAPGEDPLSDMSYWLRWFALWDLKTPGNGSFQQILEALTGLLNDQVHLRCLMETGADLHVVIEQQQGYNFNNHELGTSLMTMNGVAGALFMYYHARGYHVQLVAKQAKWGWTSLTRHFTTLERARNYRLGEPEKRSIRKRYLTHYVINLIERQQGYYVDRGIPDEVQHATHGEPLFDRVMNVALVNFMLHKILTSLTFDDRAHICDAMVQGMYAARKRFLRGSAENVIDNWDLVCALVQGAPSKSSSSPSSSVLPSTPRAALPAGGTEGLVLAPNGMSLPPRGAPARRQGYGRGRGRRGMRRMR